MDMKETGRADIYAQEQLLLDELRSKLESRPGDLDYRRELLTLAGAYEKLLRNTRKLHRIADRQYSSLLDTQDKLTSTNEDLARVSSTDTVTGLFNRHKMETFLMEEVGRFAKTATPSCLILIDLDRFKTINDTWGHNTGDLVLRAFADILRDNIRTSDFAARWGGDEFLVLLPSTRATDAERVTDGIFAAVHRARLPVQDFSVSMGVAPLEPGMALIDWLGITDQCLYWAKQSGRNRVGRPEHLS